MLSSSTLQIKVLYLLNRRDELSSQLVEAHVLFSCLCLLSENPLTRSDEERNSMLNTAFFSTLWNMT